MDKFLIAQQLKLSLRKRNFGGAVASWDKSSCSTLNKELFSRVFGQIFNCSTQTFPDKEKFRWGSHTVGCAASVVAHHTLRGVWATRRGDTTEDLSINSGLMFHFKIHKHSSLAKTFFVHFQELKAEKFYLWFRRTTRHFYLNELKSSIFNLGKEGLICYNQYSNFFLTDWWKICQRSFSIRVS